MPLTKQRASIPFSAGIDTKTDDKQLAIGVPVSLENFNLNKLRKLQKRNGYSPISTHTSTNGTISGLQKLNKFNNELVSIGARNLFAYIPSLDKWSDKGQVFTTTTEVSSVISNNKEQTAHDAVHVEGLDLVVYQDSDGVHLTIQDNNSESFLIKKQTLSASGFSPKVVNRSNTVFIVYGDGTDIKYRSFEIFNFNNISSESTLISNLNATNKNFDVLSAQERIIVAYNSSTSGGTLAFRTLLSDGTLSAITEVAGETPSSCVNLAEDSSSRVIATYSDGADAKIVIYTVTFSVKILAETSLETIAGVTNIVSTQESDGSYTVFYEVSAASSHNHYIKKQTITLSGTLGTASVFKRSVGLASKVFQDSNDYYFAVIHDSTLQSTYFVLDSSGDTVSKILQSSSGNVTTTGSLPSVDSITSTKFLLSLSSKGRLVEENGTFFSLLGVSAATISTESSLDFAELSNTLHISGDILKMYDGNNLVEHGFMLYPENLADARTATTGGSISDGTYEYIAVFAWTDANGVIHRSAPSVSTQITLSGGTSTQTQSISVPTLRLTDKEDVIVELYRTETNGTIFYKVSSTSAPTFNDPTADTVTIVDSTSDSDLINNELLYTTGGVLDNIVARSSAILESFKNRIFTTTPESDKVFYSKIQNEGFPVEFNDTYDIIIPKIGGKNVALKKMDDKLVMFKESSIHYIVGDGPNNLGEQDTFIEPELVISNIGCKTKDSVVLTPSGIMFQSDRGIYLLNRSLGLEYIGAPVEEFNNLTITSAEAVDEYNHVRFGTSDGDTLVYNYANNKWSTFTNHKSQSAIVLNTDYYYLRPDEKIYKQTDEFSDNGSPIRSKMETGWISFSGVQNYQRVYRMLLLGKFLSDHKLRIKVAYNFIDAWVQEEIIDTSDFTSSSTYGSESPYGSESTYGADNQYQLRLDFDRQKCESIKISIEDLQDSAGASMELSNLLIVLGVKGSEYKSDNSHNFGD